MPSVCAPQDVQRIRLAPARTQRPAAPAGRPAARFRARSPARAGLRPAPVRCRRRGRLPALVLGRGRLRAAKQGIPAERDDDTHVSPPALRPSRPPPSARPAAVTVLIGSPAGRGSLDRRRDGRPAGQRTQVRVVAPTSPLPWAAAAQLLSTWASGEVSISIIDFGSIADLLVGRRRVASGGFRRLLHFGRNASGAGVHQPVRRSTVRPSPAQPLEGWVPRAGGG